jgi:retinol dehydrogenase 12
LNSTKRYEPWEAYQKSKMCNILFTLELSRRLTGSGVTVNALHPGIIRTDLSRYYKEAYNWSTLSYLAVQILATPFMLWIMKSARQGAQTSIYCAVDESVENVSGRYFSDCKQKALHSQIENQADAEKLWRLSAEWANL